MSKIFTVKRGTMAVDRLGRPMTDAEWHGRVDTSESIGAAYARLGKFSNPTARAASHAQIWGIGPRAGGAR